MWFYYALVSAGFLSLRRLFEKPLSSRVPYFTLGFLSQLFSLPILCLLLLFGGLPDNSAIPAGFWWPLLVIWLVLYPIQTYSYYRAMHHGDISEVVPVLSFIPVFTIGISWLLVGEIPSAPGLLGVLCTVAGVLLLNLRREKQVVRVMTGRAAGYMLVTSCAIAVGSTLDKMALTAYPYPQFYTVVNVAGSVVVFFILSRWFGRGTRAAITSNLQPLVLAGVFQSLFYITYMMSLRSGITSYVVAIRNLNVLVSALLGIVWYRETLTRKKVVAFMSIGLGLVLLAAV